MSILLLAIAVASPPLQAEPSKQEIGYQRGALGFEDLRQANLAVAERRILADKTAEADDPAKLINLGAIYLQTGRTAEARKAFETVLKRENIELILADGSDRSSHRIARESLSRLDGEAAALKASAARTDR